MSGLRETQAQAFPERIRSHWVRTRGREIGALSNEGLIQLSEEATLQGLSQPDATEASIVLYADLLLHERLGAQPMGDAPGDAR
jgi:hypothetical protein